jgi:FtsH-binding integral membrane protein
MSTLAESRSEGNVAAKIGGALYVAWGALHLVAAWGIHVLAASLPPGIAYGRMEQAGWHLAVFALLAMALGISLNWRNDRAGYWINLVVVAAVDVGFVLLLVVPGYIPVSVGSLAGPIVYVVAAVFSTIGRLSPDTAAFRR